MAIEREQVRQWLREGLREPFLEQLADWMQQWSDALAAPSAPKELQAWMRKHPDRAAQAQAIFGRLAGYTEKLEIRTDRYAAIDALSDAELEAELCRRLSVPIEQLRAMTAKPLVSLPAGGAVTPEGEWASGGPAT